MNVRRAPAQKCRYGRAAVCAAALSLALFIGAAPAYSFDGYQIRFYIGSAHLLAMPTFSPNTIQIGEGHIRGREAISLGHNILEGQGAIAIGSNLHDADGNFNYEDYMSVRGAHSIGMGSGVRINGASALALGPLAKSFADYAIAIGREARGDGENAVALGRLARAHGATSLALGYESHAWGDKSIVLGAGSAAVGEGAISVGEGSQVDGRRSGAFGGGEDAGNFVAGDSSYALGLSNHIGRQGVVSIGGGSVLTHDPTTRHVFVVGEKNTVSQSGEGVRVNVFGSENIVDAAKRSTILGNHNHIIGDATTGNGVRNVTVVGNGAAIGKDVKSAIAIGEEVVVNTNRAVAIGETAVMLGNRSVALGNGAYVGPAALHAKYNALQAAREAYVTSSNAYDDAAAEYAQAMVDYDRADVAYQTQLLAYEQAKADRDAAASAYNQAVTDQDQARQQRDAAKLAYNNAQGTEMVAEDGWYSTHPGEPWPEEERYKSATEAAKAEYEAAETALTEANEALTAAATERTNTANAVTAMEAEGSDYRNAIAARDAAMAELAEAYRDGLESASADLAAKTAAYEAAENALIAGANAANEPLNAVAIGTGAAALHSGDVAIGSGDIAGGLYSIAIGTGNQAAGDGSGAIGDPNYVAAHRSYAVGNDNAVGVQTFDALGVLRADNTSEGIYVFGENNNVAAAGGSSYISVLGANNIVAKNSSAQNLFVAGSQNELESVNDTAVVGSGNIITAAGSSAVIGGGNSFNGANDVFVLGSGVTTVADNSVFLGSGAAYTHAGKTTAGTDEYSRAVVGSVTYEFAGGQAGGVVSVGAPDSPRRIQNVAAGLIGKDSTDAVNGSQLFAVMNGLKWNVSDGTGSGEVKPGGTVTFKGGGSVSVTYTDGVLTIADGGTGGSEAGQGGSAAPGTADTEVSSAVWNLAVGDEAEGVSVGAKQTVRFVFDAPEGSDNLFLTRRSDGGEHVVAAGIKKDPVFAGRVKATGGFDAGGQTIVNMAAGNVSKNSLEAVNGAQLYSAAESAAQTLGGGARVENGRITGFNVNMKAAAKKGYTSVAEAIEATDATVYGMTQHMKTKRLTVTGDAELQGSVTVGKKLTVNGPAYFNDTLSMNGNKITGLKKGEIGPDSTDAVNGSQLYELENKVSNSVSSVSGRLTREIRRTGSRAAALAGLHPLPYDEDAPTTFNVAVGNYRGDTTVAVGLAHHFSRDTMLSFAGTIGDEPMVNAGLALRLGRHDESVIKARAAKRKATAERNKLLGQLSSQEAKMEAYKQQDAVEKQQLRELIEAQRRELDELKRMIHGERARKKR